MASKKFLKELDIHFISLVKAGANKKQIIYKSAEHEENPVFTKVIPIAKTDEEKQMVYGIVYSPEEVDTQGEYTTAEEIEKAAHKFMREARTGKIDKQHDEKPEHGFVAESWILKEGDPTFPDEASGSWAVGIKIENDETWEEVKKGEIKGLSMGGFAVKEEVEEKTEKGLIEKITEAVRKAFAPVSKDFNSQYNSRAFEEMTWALSSAIRDALNNEKIKDKKKEILKNIEQFKSSVEKLNFENLSTKKSEDSEMTKEEIIEVVEKAVAAQIEKAEKKHEEQIGELKESIEKQSEELKSSKEQIEKLEKATAGSVQGDDPHAHEDEKNNWL